MAGCMLSLLATSCGSSGCDEPDSEPLRDGQSDEVAVGVSDQRFSPLDVNGGFYEVPYEPPEPPVVRLEAGSYDGRVTNEQGRLVLRFEERTAVLGEPIRCE